MTLDEIGDRYRVILCDIWGCIHDGVQLYPGAADRLRRWRDEGRTTILITNAPRSAEAVAGQLVRLGLDPALWDGIATAGDAGIACLKEADQPIGFIGTAGDRAVLEAGGVRISGTDDFDELACAGLDGRRREVSDYEEQLRSLVARDVLMHCLNPDRLVILGGSPVPCAGALADRYIVLGGRVEWYGKPFPAIYRHAMDLAGNPAACDVLVLGDGLETDILGGARMGFDCVFVAGGIAQGRSIPSDFAEKHGLGNWRPLTVVNGLH